MTDLFRDTTDADKVRLREVLALDRMYQGRTLQRRRGYWVRTLGYWLGATWTLLAMLLWGLAVWVASL